MSTPRALALSIASLSLASLSLSLGCRGDPPPSPPATARPAPPPPSRSPSTNPHGPPPRPAPQVTADASTDAGSTDDALVPPGSQPRWRYLARGPRPRGAERWRFDLAPREALGELATDGVTVYVTAAKVEAEGVTDGEVYAFDLASGALRWHTPVGGVHGAPVELARGVVLVDTIPHCARAGTGARRCEERGPGGVVGLDAAAGRVLFRTSAQSDAPGVTFTSVEAEGGPWVHDGLMGLRALALPSGAQGARVTFPGPLASAVGVERDVLYVARTRRGTVLGRRALAARRPRWERPILVSGGCAPLLLGPLAVVGAFASPTLTGAPRAISTEDGSELWAGSAPPHQVDGCGAIERAVLYQAVELRLQGTEVVHGYRGSSHPLPGQPTSPLNALLDGVFYMSFNDRLLGLDVVDGHTAMTLVTGAHAVEGLVLWRGRGVVATRRPGLVLAFE